MPSHGLKFDRNQKINDTHEFDYDTTLVKYNLGRATRWDKCFLAECERTNPKILKVLMVEPDVEIRQALARNVSIDISTLETWCREHTGEDKVLADGVVEWKKNPPPKEFGEKGFIMTNDPIYSIPKE